MAAVTDIAEESEKTKKARKKIQQEIDASQKKITHEHLEKKRIEIHQWIARHAQNRVILKDKAISLFDGNQNTASLSKRIQKIADHLQQENLSIRKLNDISIEHRYKKKGSSCSKNPIEIASLHEKHH